MATEAVSTTGEGAPMEPMAVVLPAGHIKQAADLPADLAPSPTAATDIDGQGRRDKPEIKEPMTGDGPTSAPAQRIREKMHHLPSGGGSMGDTVGGAPIDGRILAPRSLTKRKPPPAVGRSGKDHLPPVAGKQH